jgi:hypothetical protein
MEHLRQAETLADPLVKESPAVPKYRVLAADVCRLMARNLLAQGDPARAETYALKAIDDLKSLASLYPELPSYLGMSLGRAYTQLEKVLAQRKQIDKARAAAELAVNYLRDALKASRESPTYRRHLWDAYFDYGKLRIPPHPREVEAVATGAEELPRLWPDNADSYTQAAWVLIQCAEAAPDRQAELLERATRVLATGVNQGKLDRRGLQQRHFERLRDREDFRRLLPPAKPPKAG